MEDTVDKSSTDDDGCAERDVEGNVPKVNESNNDDVISEALIAGTVEDIPEEVSSVGGEDVSSVGEDVSSVGEDVSSVGEDVSSVGEDVPNVSSACVYARERVVNLLSSSKEALSNMVGDSSDIAREGNKVKSVE